MKIEFKFNSKSSGQNVPEAIRLAEKHGGFIEDRYYKINFESPEDKDLTKLFELVGNLKGTAISINGEEPVVARKFFNAVNCPEKFLCKGICRHVRIGYYDFGSFLDENSENIENGIFSTSDENLIRYMTDFLEMVEENRFRFNKDRFLEYFQRETEMEHKFCKKFNFEKTKKELEKLPEEIQLVPRKELEEYEERFGYEEEYEVENTISTILTHCELSSKLSFKDVLQCSKALSLLINERGCATIEDTDVLIYSFPVLRQIILAKLIFYEKFIDELDEEELKYIATKENDFFCASNPISRLYFQIFNEDDSTIKECFEKLKRLKK